MATSPEFTPPDHRSPEAVPATDEHAERPRDAIACITFDLDDTLWPVMPAIQRAEARFYAWCREHAPEIVRAYSPEALVAERARFMRTAPEHERHDLTTLRKRWLRQLAETHGACPQRLSNAGFDVFWKARCDVDPFPEVPTLLERLARHHCIGAISNGNADVFRTPLGAHFDFAVSAIEAGAAKPHPAPFQLAVERAGVDPGRILHVGDDPLGDVCGARDAGFEVLWFNPQGLPWPRALGPRPPATARLGTLLERGTHRDPQRSGHAPSPTRAGRAAAQKR